MGQLEPTPQLPDPPARGVDDGDGDDGLTQEAVISSRLIKQQTLDKPYPKQHQHLDHASQKQYCMCDAARGC